MEMPKIEVENENPKLNGAKPSLEAKFVFKTGDIFCDKSEYIVNPVNTQGVMGAGLARQFKENYPKHFQFYKKYCDSGDFKIGSLIRFHERGRGIICIPTKEHWKDPSKLEYVEKGLQSIIGLMKAFEIKSIALPKLGCGLGGLDYEKEVKPLIIKTFKDMPNLTVTVYE